MWYVREPKNNIAFCFHCGHVSHCMFGIVDNVKPYNGINNCTVLYILYDNRATQGPGEGDWCCYTDMSIVYWVHSQPDLIADYTQQVFICIQSTKAPSATKRSRLLPAAPRVQLGLLASPFHFQGSHFVYCGARLKLLAPFSLGFLCQWYFSCVKRVQRCRPCMHVS